MQSEQKEFDKLEEMDSKVLRWIIVNDPRAIQSWIECIVKEYQGKRKPIEIDPKKLSLEIEMAGKDKN